MGKGVYRASRRRLGINEKPFIYLDVGGWLGKDKGGTAMSFGVITDSVVALCSYNDHRDRFYKEFKKHQEKRLKQLKISLRDFKNFRMMPLESWSPTFSRFLKSITGEDDWDAICRKHLMDFMILTTEIEKEKLTKADEIIVVFPDWHLSVLKESLLDNFVVCDKWAPERENLFGKKIKKREKDCSLEKPLAELLSNILKHKKNYPGLNIQVIQAGDLYELWEANYLIQFSTLFNNLPWRQRMKLLDDSVNAVNKLIREYSFGVKPETKPFYKAFEKFGYVKPIVKIRSRIEKNYPKLFGLFNNNRTKLQGWGVEIPFHFIQGNHDNWLFWSPPDYLSRKKPKGIWARKTPSGKGVIHVEHGHFADPHNYNNWLFGYDVTCLNAVAEINGLGAWAKSKTPPISEMRISNYFPYSSNVADWYRRKKKKNLAVFCMAHTHQPYIAYRTG